MLGGFIALAHVFEYNLIGNAVAHGALSLPIIKGFAISLAQCSIAHPVAAGITAFGGFIIKGLSSFL